MKQSRLDIELARRHLVASRSQAESWIKLGKVMVNGLVITKTGYKVGENDEINLLAENQYVSRAGLKLESVSDKLKLDFKNKIVLDVGSSTGGFTEFSLKNGAKKVIAVDVGTDQLHPSLRANPNIELHEKTDIRDVVGPIARSAQKIFKLMDTPDIILIDVSFISQREILPHIFDNLAGDNTLIISMAKPQFEAGREAREDDW